MAKIGETDYRNGAKERLKEAFVLLRQEWFAGSIYLAGRAVESMLRAMVLNRDPEYATGKKSLDTGHDLRQTLMLVGNLGVFREQNQRESIAANVEKVWRLWSNNMRYWPTTKVKREWLDLREIGGRRTLKTAAGE